METIETKRAVFSKVLEWHQAGQTAYELCGRMYPWDGRLACAKSLDDLGGLMGEW
ncbi:hypothetical protein [Cupriavidus nantongensis]|uniref:hypothetical protein n=1 Tax=Cupriavidus nantongensis TaxID=1796606 RepID=UPI000ACE8757|nr:hypothetical protein [Cupriavidus nantongensis]